MKTYRLPDGTRVYTIGNSIADYICFVIVLLMLVAGIIGACGWVTLLGVLL